MEQHEGTKARRHEGAEEAAFLEGAWAEGQGDGMSCPVHAPYGEGTPERAAWWDGFWVSRGMRIHRAMAAGDGDGVDQVDRVDEGERGPVPAVLRGDWIEKFNEMMKRLDAFEARLREVESWASC